MIHSDQFHNGAGLDLHARTTIQDYFSYMETAALRVGAYTIEFYPTKLYVNGHLIAPEELPVAFGGDGFQYTISNAEVETGKNRRFHQYYKADLGESSFVLFKFYKQYLTLSVSGHAKDFSDSVGILGDYSTGDMINRDGDVMVSFDEFGFEWQVTPEDPKLFLENRAPQLPFEACRMPTAPRPALRKLRGGDPSLLQEAETACAHVRRGSDFDLCTEDILATGDVGLASVW